MKILKTLLPILFVVLIVSVAICGTIVIDVTCNQGGESAWDNYTSDLSYCNGSYYDVGTYNSLGGTAEDIAHTNLSNYMTHLSCNNGCTSGGPDDSCTQGKSYWNLISSKIALAMICAASAEDSYDDWCGGAGDADSSWATAAYHANSCNQCSTYGSYHTLSHTCPTLPSHSTCEYADGRIYYVPCQPCWAW